MWKYRFFGFYSFHATADVSLEVKRMFAMHVLHEQNKTKHA